MASQLTIVAVTARKLIKFGIFGIIALSILRLLWQGAFGVYRNVVPPKESPPTLGFGSLPELKFPDLEIELPELRYRLETSSGVLPTFPTRMKVYAMPRPTSDLFSYDRMITVANAYGFTRDPIQLSNRSYRFNHPEVPATMEVDVITSTFSISFNLTADSSPLTNRSPTVSEATNTVQSRLSKAQITLEDLSDQASHIFLKVEGRNLVKANSLAEAQLVQINLFRQAINLDSEEETEYPIVTANPNQANVWFIVSGSNDNSKQIIAGEFRHFRLDRSLYHTYSIKTPEQALEELQAGEGYIANLGLNVDGNIVITDIYLAYYDPNDISSFMQPIIVLEGRDNFYAYVPAIVDSQIQQEESTEEN